MRLRGRSKRTRRFVFAGLIALVLVVGASFSALGAPTPTTFYGCLNNGGNINRITNSGPVNCPGDQTAVSWNSFQSGDFIWNSSAQQPDANFNISGDGTIAGTLNAGTANVSGDATVGGTLSANTANVTNDATVGGKLSANTADVTNDATVGGNLTADSLTANGVLTAGTATVSGDTTVGGNLGADSVSVTKDANIGGNASIAGTLTLSGGFQCSGCVTTDDIADGNVTNAKLANSSVTVTAGTGLSGGGTVALGGSTTLSNTGVLSVGASGPLSSSGGQNPTISLSGTVSTANGGTGLTSPGQSGNVLTSNGTTWTSSPLPTPSGINGLTYNYADFGNIDPAHYLIGTVSCGSGWAIGGGADSGDNQTFVWVSRPSDDGHGWRVAVTNTGVASGDVRAYVVCVGATNVTNNIP